MNNFGSPVVERPFATMQPLPQGLGKSEVEAGIVDADDDIRRFGLGKIKQTGKHSPEKGEALEDLEADDGVPRQLIGQFHTSRPECGSTGTYESW